VAEKTEAQRLAAELDAYHTAPHHKQAAAELRRLEHNNQLLKNALWKACGDDEEMVKEIIESQGELK
jgi:hypothetical protein